MIGNTAFIHPQCAESRRQHWQKHNRNTLLQVGHWVQIELQEGDITEHLWIRITGIMGDIVAGVVDNDPVMLRQNKCGDTIVFNRREIEAHLT